MNTIKYFPPIPFFTINNISISNDSSNLTFVFYEKACYAKSGAEKNGQGQ